MKSSRRGLVLACLLLFLLPAFGQDLASFEKRVTVKKLSNGLTVVICRRPEAPVFSFFTLVDAGSVQDPNGETGLAHMFEHMAFKGTPSVGTKDYAAEKAALEKVEKAYAAYRAESLKEVNKDPKKMEELHKAWKDAVAKADKYVIPEQFSNIVESSGGVGMNASTSMDQTVYFYSMPVNREQLWAYLEADRMAHPVMREFYKERDVVIEERRMRTDSNPIGRLVEQFTSEAYTAHPYHRPTIGWMSDLNNFSASDAMQFYKTFYVPSNITIAVVGDVNPEQLLPVIEKYFGKIPASPQPPPIRTKEPVQNSERLVTLHEKAQPLFLEGYHRPDYRDPDDVVYDAITDLMSNGRTSRLFRALVRDKKIAADSEGFSGFPGQKYPNLFAFYAVPTPGHTTKELAEAIHAEIERVKTQDITDEELKMIKTRAKADLIRSLGDNEGLAQALAIYQARYGDWRELFRQVDKIDKVSKADIRRVSNKIFTPENRTVGVLETQGPAKGDQQ
jgi:predicted Zn-dependent peptidase